MNIPCFVYHSSYIININRLLSICELVQLKDLSPSSINTITEKLGNHFYNDYFEEKNVIVEFQGFYIYNKVCDIKGQIKCISCIFNQYGKVLYISLNSALSFYASDEQSISIKFDDYCNIFIELMVDKKSRKVKFKLQNDENEALHKIIIGEKCGLVNNSMEILLPIEYDEISIIGNVVCAKNTSKCILWHATKGIIEEVLLDYRKDLSYRQYSIKSLTPNHIRFYNLHCIKKDIDMIIDKEGNIIFYQIDSLAKYGDLYVIYPNNTISHEELTHENYSYEADDDPTQHSICSIFDKNLTQLFPNIFFEDITYCKDGVFIAKNNIEHIILDSHGKKIFSTDRYFTIHDFNEGLAVVERNGLYGVIDITGKEIVQCIHSKISDFKEGIATTYKYDTKIDIYKDGSMQDVLYGKVCHNIYCHIVNNRLIFIRNNKEKICNFLQSCKNDLLLVTYENEEYKIHDEFTNGTSDGKLFFVDKKGLIISYKSRNSFMRLSATLILLGTQELKKQKISDKSLNSIPEDWFYRNNKTFIIDINGKETEYLSSLDNDTHFVLWDNKYAIVNNYMECLWSTSNTMNILSKGKDFYKIYTFSNYEDKVHNDTHIKIQVWNSRTNEGKTIIASCAGNININSIKISLNGKYMIVPVIHSEGYYIKQTEFYLLVLNESDEITIDENFGQAKIEKIMNDKILLSEYYTDSCSEWNDYHEITIIDGYILLSLNGIVLGKVQTNRHEIHYITIEKSLGKKTAYESSSNNIRYGIYDLDNDREIVPTEYKYCKIIDCDQEVYTIVKGENDKLGLYYGASKILECAYKEIKCLTIHAEKKGECDSPELEMNTDYLCFQNHDGENGLIYRGKIIHQISKCKIKGINTTYSDCLFEGSDFALVSCDDLLYIYHKENLIRSVEICEIRIFQREENNYFLKLIDGEREGLIGEKQCFIPLDYHKIRLDSLFSDPNWHICIIGDCIYEKDGKTIFLGNEHEVLVAFYSLYQKCYVFWNRKHSCYVFYNENRKIIQYEEEDNPSLGTIVNIPGLYEVVFSYEKRKFIKSPHYKEENEESKEFNNYEDYDDTHSIYDNPYYDDNLDMDQQSLDFWE